MLYDGLAKVWGLQYMRLCFQSDWDTWNTPERSPTLVKAPLPHSLPGSRLTAATNQIKQFLPNELSTFNIIMQTTFLQPLCDYQTSKGRQVVIVFFSESSDSVPL